MERKKKLGEQGRTMCRRGAAPDWDDQPEPRCLTESEIVKGVVGEPRGGTPSRLDARGSRFDVQGVVDGLRCSKSSGCLKVSSTAGGARAGEHLRLRRLCRGESESEVEGTGCLIAL